MRHVHEYLLATYNLLSHIRDEEPVGTCAKCAIDKTLALGRMASAEMVNNTRDQQARKANA